MYGFEDFFEIDARVYKQAKKRGVTLDDSKYADMATGLPFHIPFVVTLPVVKGNLSYTELR